MSKNYFVAVYGTLKRGERNHRLMISTNSEFISNGKTAEKYPLVITGVPYLFENKGVGHQVELEVYRVSERGLATLDRLEGHPNFYIRKPILCELSDGAKRVCLIYFINKKRTSFEEFALHEKF